MDYECKLTTHDNPFDPFEQFDAWYLFDKEKGYDCCERLARVLHVEDDYTQKEVDLAIEEAIDIIVELDFTNTYKKVTRKVSVTE